MTLLSRFAEWWTFNRWGRPRYLGPTEKSFRARRVPWWLRMWLS